MSSKVATTPNIRRVGSTFSVTKIRRLRSITRTASNSSTKNTHVDNVIHINVGQKTIISNTKEQRIDLATKSAMNFHKSQLKSNTIQSLAAWPNRSVSQSSRKKRSRRHRSLSPGQRRNRKPESQSSTSKRIKDETNQGIVNDTMINSKNLPTVTPLDSYMNLSVHDSFRLANSDTARENQLPQLFNYHQQPISADRNQKQTHKHCWSMIPMRVRLLLLGISIVAVLIVGLVSSLVISSKKSLTETSTTTTSTTATTATTTTATQTTTTTVTTTTTTSTTTASTSSTSTTTTSTSTTSSTTTSTSTTTTSITTTTTTTSTSSTTTTSSTSTTTATSTTTSTSTTTTSTTTTTTSTSTTSSTTTSTSTTTTTSSTSTTTTTSTTTSTTSTTTTSSTSTTTTSTTSMTTTSSTSTTTTSTTSMTTTSSTSTTTTSTTTTSTSTTTATTTSETTTTTTSTTTTKNPYACGNMTILVGYDIPSNDLTSNRVANYTLCCNWCLSYSGCVGFVWGLPSAGFFVAGFCFLKKNYTSVSTNSNLVSAHI